MATFRQAAGTRTFGDLLRGRLHSSSTSDLEALDRGETLVISGYALSDGAREQGRLVLVTQPDTRLSWQSWVAVKGPLRGYGEAVELRGPYAWVSEDGRPQGMKGMFRQVTFTAAGHLHQVGIAVKDIPTLQTALEESGT